MGQAQYTSNRLHYPGQFEKPKLNLSKIKHDSEASGTKLQIFQDSIVSQ